ncbi:hypothetical protein CRG98_009976 [Punica granatum]|uniref:DC1 domain-containing protein n=1 Tax=Punica granatum TaxID=22663 RepID=A0A2I0KMA0_PUNGR|nr:hypothetical protein CRG98_009976 [Punica granatum]
MEWFARNAVNLFLQDMHVDVRIAVIIGTCRASPRSGDTKFFRCLSPGCPCFCHFHCIPFDVPKSIKHKYHYHPLTFTESYAEDGRDEHYCNACEEERDPRAAEYRCEECDFTAHTAWAIS